MADTLMASPPLADIRIVTIALNVPGPMAAERLRDFGAQVLKIEPPTGDPLQSFRPAWYADLARGMTVERCDLKTPGGRTRIYELLERADIFLTAQRPVALARLGLAWQELHERFPRLCQVAIVGHPAPDDNLAGHDLTYAAPHGLLRPPALPPTLYIDVASSERACFAALAALKARERTGTGHYAEVALADVAERLAAPLRAGLTRMGAMLGGAHPGYNLYRTRDGWIAVAALEPHFYERLCRELGVATPSTEAMAARFAAEPTAHWLRFAANHDLPLAAISDVPGR